MVGHNYLIGFGERLVTPISLKTGGGPKRFPYSFDEARARLSGEWKHVADDACSLPDLACPSGRTVFSLTLHPTFLARSYYPGHLLDDLNLRAVGSQARAISPEVANARRPSEKLQPAPAIYVEGLRRDIVQFAKILPTWNPYLAGVRDDFRKLEDVRSLDLSRLKPVSGEDLEPPLEIILHASESESDDYILEGFEAYAGKLGIHVDLDLRLHAGGLCFVPIRAPRECLEELTAFSFIRAVRRMPRLSLNETILRTFKVPGGFPVKLPEERVVNPDARVAIFDGGGVGADSDIAPWVRSYDAPGAGIPSAIYKEHGLGVTSALLFGPLTKGEVISVPYSYIDHWRVLDSDTQGDDFELMAVLRRIVNVLRQRKYDLVCLSIGPAMPIEDNEVHVWTSMLDTHLSGGDTVLLSACGNTGDDDWEAGNARIQPCSDAVNAVGVGAANSRETIWQRAPYSSIGPGRSPGFIKPDLVAFGGSETEPFWLLDSNRRGFSAARMGTSYAAPNAGRTGLGIKAHFGSQLTAAAIKGLMVHHSARDKHSQQEVGWGRMPTEVDQYVICPDGEVSVLYQGKLEPSQFIRFPIPVPRDPLHGRVTIRATFCFFSPVDPEDSLNYTRAGLGIVFRPSTIGHPGYNDDGKPRGVHRASNFFRSQAYYSTELERRRDAHKWETVLRDQRRFAPGILDQPVFDVEHHARLHGGPAHRRTDISYSLVVTLASEDEPNLYNRILAAYPNQLQILQPIIEVPITVRR